MLAGFALACVGTPVHSQAPAAGFVVATPSGQVQFYLSRPLRPDMPLWVQWPDESGQIACCRRFKRSELTRRATRAPEPVVIADAYEILLSSGQTPVRYVLRRVSGTAPVTPFVGIAMAAPSVHSLGDRELQSSTGQRARTCFGTEGVNLLSQYQQRKSAAYLSLGYPVDPLHPCTREDEDFIATATD